jgi:isoleucyl-tRNA synthetase
MDKTGLRKHTLEEIDRVEWIPYWGRDRIYGMIENRPDWCVSRQRAWGVPITVFYCDQCDFLHMDHEIVNRVVQLFTEHGADAWFDMSVESLLPGNPACKNCGNQSFVKETDILDVWFDSGVSHAAVLEERSNLKWPADLYLEGSDQHRGWFHSSLLTAVGTRGAAPYKAVLTHGFVVDAEGRKMSKSIGNVVAPKEVIDKYGAEILRLWVSAADYRDDIRISENILKQLSDAYRRIRNTSRFMLGNLSDFDPITDTVEYADMLEIDRFAIHRLQELVDKANQAYAAYEFHTIYHRIYNYCTLDLSAFYLDVLKDRLYTSTQNSPARRSAQTAIYIILDTITRIMAPILSFTAEEIWTYMPNRPDKEKSIHLCEMHPLNPKYRDEELAEKWNVLLEIRTEVTKALETARTDKLIGHPLDAMVTVSVKPSLHESIFPYSEDLRSIFIVSKAALVKDKTLKGAYKSEQMEGVYVLVEKAPGEKCERCWIYDPSVGTIPEHPVVCNRCQTTLERI